ncbi:MAG: hypothetical protein J3Q66DRAFT_362784 [Benniella sp.]|nr:MAG: hypothetical protein J3Q66DRAFT_362784 [Benniella sp.]
MTVESGVTFWKRNLPSKASRNDTETAVDKEQGPSSRTLTTAFEGTATALKTNMDSTFRRPNGEYHQRQVFTFTTAEGLFQPEKPKLTTETVLKLQEIVTILAPENELLQTTQQALTLLKQQKTAFCLLNSALRTSTFEEIPKVLLGFAIPEGPEKKEMELINIVQFVLTDFSSKMQPERGLFSQDGANILDR